MSSGGNEWYWLGTALVAAGVMLVFCLLAAFTAGWASPYERDSLFAAWVAAGVATITYVIATGVSVATFPVPFLMVCSCPLGLIFGCLILAFAPGLADLGAEMRVARRERRRAT